MRMWPDIPVRFFPYKCCLVTIREQNTVMVVGVWGTGSVWEIRLFQSWNELYPPKYLQPVRGCINIRQGIVYRCRCIRPSEPVDQRVKGGARRLKLAEADPE